MDPSLEERLKLFTLSCEETEEIKLEQKDIVLSKAECERSLIGKIFGAKKINFFGFKNTIRNIWLTKDTFTVSEIGDNLFQFIFSSQEDKVRVRNGKAWSFDNQYLILRDWSEDVLNNSEAFQSVELWVQLWNIPYHWLSVETGKKIGKKFGKLMDIIIPETGSCKGKYIKMLVEVSLEKPLLRGTNIKLDEESNWVEFRYENLQSFCFYCGRIGHTERGCQVRKMDIELDRLNIGQFGEWIRASDLDFPKPSIKATKSVSGNERVVLQKELKENPMSGLAQTCEAQFQGGMEEHQAVEKLQGDQKSASLKIQLPVGKFSMDDQATSENKRGEVVIKETESRIDENKENDMMVESNMITRNLGQGLGNRIPLCEIKNHKSGEENNTPKITIKLERKCVKKYGGKGPTPKPMEIIEQNAEKSGIKRNYNWIQNSQERNPSEAKRLKTSEEVRKDNVLSEKVEVASLEWAQSYK